MYINKYIYIYIYISMHVIMKTICPPGYHHNRYVATHALGYMMYGYIMITVHHVPKCMNYHKAIVVTTRRAYCFHDCIYIMPILLL